MKRKPVQDAVRRTKQKRRVGEHAVCVLCRRAEPEALKRVALSELNGTTRRLVEQHHVVGKRNDATLTVPICLSCHAVATEQLRSVAASMQQPRTLLEKLIAILKALGVFFKQLGESCLKWAAELAAFVQSLDARFPAWRTMPEAT